MMSCNKDPYEIGYDLLPPTDTLYVKTTDTITVEAFSVLQDSVRSDKHGSLILGSVADPVFGTTTSSFYSAFKLSNENPDFGTNPILDSLVLVLYYAGYSGDTLSRLNVKVYEIAEDLVYDSIRYTNQNLAYYPTVLADHNFVPNLSDSVSVNDTKEAPQLRINLSKLTNSFGNKILYAPSSALQSNANFVKFVKGLYVSTTPVSSNGALLNFSISGNVSKLMLYFHDGDDPENDSLKYTMVLNETCGRFIHIDHNDYLDASHDLKQQIINHDTVRGRDKLFLQGMGGVKVKVKFPHFKDFEKGKLIAINDALLEMQNYETDTTWAPPSSLMLMRQDSAGRLGYLADEGEGTAYFGGIYDESKRTYTFRLTQHLQNILQNKYKTSFDLYMMVNSTIKSSLSPQRVVLNGTNPLMPGSNAGSFRLKLTYTILN